MDIEASIRKHWNLQFKSAFGEDFYYESGIGSVAVPAGSNTSICRLPTEPSWESVRSVVPFVAVEVYSGDGMLRMPYVKDFGWGWEERRIALRFVLPIEGEDEYEGDFTFSLAVLGHLVPPYMLPVEDR